VSANPDDKQPYSIDLSQWIPWWKGSPPIAFPRDPGVAIGEQMGGQTFPPAVPVAPNPWGPKMPPAVIPKAEKAIKAAEQKAEDRSEGTFFGVFYSQWQKIGIYGLLLVLLLFGIWGLLGAASVPTPQGLQKVVVELARPKKK